jgi:hypothetical protein
MSRQMEAWSGDGIVRANKEFQTIHPLDRDPCSLLDRWRRLCSFCKPQFTSDLHVAGRIKLSGNPSPLADHGPCLPGIVPIVGTPDEWEQYHVLQQPEAEKKPCVVVREDTPPPEQDNDARRCKKPRYLKKGIAQNHSSGPASPFHGSSVIDSRRFHQESSRSLDS